MRIEPFVLTLMYHTICNKDGVPGRTRVVTMTTLVSKFAFAPVQRVELKLYLIVWRDPAAK